jgi:succinoglycan biosynthesis protein ExoM
MIMTVAICICTYNRAEGLSAALRSLDAQRLTTLGLHQLTVIVVDNSADATAKAVCDAYAAHGRFVFRCVHQPAKGLVHARNACLAAATREGATHILFLDDDEAATPGWVEALLARMAETGAAAAIGPVFPIFERVPPVWLPAYRFVNRVETVGGFAEDGHSCNAAISTEAIRAANLSFDMRFNETGGEDTMFFKALRASGHRIAWAQDAQVHEFVPAHRMSAIWLFRRWYRTGIVEAQLAQGPAPSAGGRLRNLARGLARLTAGGARSFYALVFHGWREPDRVVASLYTLCRGAGYASGALGLSYKEYSLPSYR